MIEKNATSSSGVPFRDFQVAFETYFSDLNAVSNEVQRRFQEIQLEYIRNLQNQAPATKDLFTAQKDFQGVQDKFMRDSQSASMDTSAFSRFSEAYEKYKNSVQSALTGADLDPTTMAILGQQLLIVAQTACQLNCAPPATASASSASAPNPFSGSGGPAPANNPFNG